MRKLILLAMTLALTSLWSWGQSQDSTANTFTNSADNLLQQDAKLVVGGYGEVHYNQPINGNTRSLGEMDVHRVVMLFGYNFNDRTKFITELEFEHVKEVYVEQAFLQYKLNDFISLRGGLMLIPMGIINEYHEPTTFNGVERPLVDKYIVPTTWREIGFGVTGNILPASIKYQAYVVNGFNGYGSGSAGSYDAKLGGSSGLRGGRQKGAESYISAPNFTGKIEYFGIRGLNIGLSGYFGNTQSALYDGLDKSDPSAISSADSSVVGISMVGVDTRYSLKGLQLRGQFYYAGLSNTDQYNEFTAEADGTPNNLGSALLGYYAEVGYNVLRSATTETRLIPFVRLESLDTHQRVESNITENLAYHRSAVTTGLTLELTRGAVAKVDVQFLKNASNNEYTSTFNAGVGVMF